MSSPFQPLKCGLFCQTEAEFSLKFVVTALSLTDEDEDNGFEDILVTITFDGNVFKIDDFKETAEGGVELVGRGLDLRLTPEKFSEKLRTCPIMFNLSRGCNELGTVKLEFSECFMDAPKCEDFEKQSVSNDLKFIKENEMNGLMALICQVSREVNLNVFKGLKTPKKLAETKSIEKISNDSSLSYSCSGISTSGSTDREPLDADDSELFHRTTSSKTKSSRSKCQSDIAASLDICDYSGDQQTYCNACEKFSISGVTCDNKSLTKIQQVLFCKSEEKIPLVCDPCKVLTPAKKRICQECFEDLTVLPCNAPCPNCARHAQLQRKLISFKSQKVKKQEGEQIRNCIRSIVEEIFFDTKDQLIKDWQRLKKEPQKKKAKNVVTKKRRCTQESLKPYQSSPRNSKTLKEKKKSKSIGLRKKNIGVVRGHQYCQGDGFLVPKNMGWLWNVGICGLSQLRRGWKPGSVRKSVAKIMKEHLTPPAEPAPELANIEQKDPPTLSVKKKQGEYLIVMNPLGMDKELMGLPIVFKIEKSEEGIKRSKARKILKERGVEKTCDCPCIDTCDCLSACEKDRIKFELKCVSKKLCMKSQMTINDVKESSDSEMDMEFTPPSAMKSKNPCRKIPVKFSYAETQYEVQESIPVHETEVADYKTQKSQKTEVKFEGKTKKTLKTKEKSKELKQKTEKAKAIKEKKVGSKKEKLRSATVEKEEKSKSKQQLQRKQKISLHIQDPPAKSNNICAPVCEDLCFPSRPSHRFNSCNTFSSPQPAACLQYSPIYY